MYDNEINTKEDKIEPQHTHRDCGGNPLVPFALESSSYFMYIAPLFQGSVFKQH